MEVPDSDTFFDVANRKESQRQAAWRNGVLVFVSNRLGLKKMQNEYMEAVRSFCMHRLNCGIIGGRPKEAFYLVGIQDQNMIILDPHNAQPALPNEIVVL